MLHALRIPNWRILFLSSPEHFEFRFGRDSAIIRQSSDPESAESSVAYRMRVFGHDHSGLTPGMSDQDKSMPGMSRQEGSPREMEAARIAAQNMVMLDKLKNTITDTYDTICEDNAADVTTLDAQAATASKAGERAQKDAEAVRIAAPNKALRGKLKNTKEVTNSDITNGVAAHGTSVGAGRAKAAASSKARKDAEAQ